MVTALLAEVVRGPLVESEHRGHVVVTAPGAPDAPRLVLGDPDVVFWPRSSVKPLQAAALMRAGLEIDDEGLALACASHSGEPRHLAVVRTVLAAAGLDEQDLRNTPDLPLDASAAARWAAEGHGPASVTQNCSGKHAAMLATCVRRGWPTTSYLDPEHPLQRAVRDAVAELTGVPVAHVTVDGCGAPLLSTTPMGLATALGRIAAAPGADPGSPEARVARAMTTHPALVGGTGRDVTAFMGVVPGLVAKDGADGVYAAGLPDGTGIAIKVADGSARPRAVVLARALEIALTAARPPAPREVLEAVREVGRTPVLGHGRPVGEVRAVFGRD